MDIFSYESLARLGPDNIFVKLDRLLDWQRIGIILKPTRHDLGQTGYAPACLFRAILLGQWHSLSDRELEHALRVRLDFMLFSGFSVHDHVPDHSTLCRFRNLLVELNLFEVLLADINKQLEEHGLKLAIADHAIIDATVITSAARPRRVVEVMAEDRKEEAVLSEVTTQFSCDDDARWLKKGNRYYFGYKGFARVDDEGYFDKLLTRPANEGEAPHFSEMSKSPSARRVLSDKGNASKANREVLKRRGLKDGIMHKAARGRPLTHWEKVKNKLISKHRYVVEQSFGTLKRKFHMRRASYMGCTKVQAQLIAKAICLNLLKAANKITINPTTS